MSCSTHRDESNRVLIDRRLQGLPLSQSGESRHKCPYCAYGLGIAEGYERARAELETPR